MVQALANNPTVQKLFPNNTFSQQQIPSAYGVGPFPYDFTHGHLASSLALNAAFIQQANAFNLFLTTESKKQGIVSLDLGKKAPPMTIFDNSLDINKYVSFFDATSNQFANIIAASWNLPNPFMVYHTMEFEEYGTNTAPRDPIRQIRTNQRSVIQNFTIRLEPRATFGIICLIPLILAMYSF